MQKTLLRCARTHSAALFSQAMHRGVGVLGALMVRMAAVQARGRGRRAGAVELQDT